MSDAPERIWVGKAYRAKVGVDWSELKVFASDVEYVRKDIHDAAVSKARVDALKEAVDLITSDMAAFEKDMSRVGQILASQKRPSVRYRIRRADFDARRSIRSKISALIEKEPKP